MAEITKNDTIRALAAGGTVAVDRIIVLESTLRELVEARDRVYRSRQSLQKIVVTEAEQNEAIEANRAMAEAWDKARKELGEGGGK